MTTGVATDFSLAVQADFATKPDVTEAGRIFQAVALESISAPGEFEYIENQNQSRGIHGRASTQQSVPTKIGFMTPVEGQSGLYLNSLVPLLYAMGFSKTGAPTGTDPYTWELTKDDVCAARWAAGFLSIAACDDDNNTHLIKKLMWQMRMTQLTLNLSTSGGNIGWSGLALQEGTTGTPTTTNNDSTFALSPITGSLSFPSAVGGTSGAELLNAPMTHTITISRPVDTEDKKMHSISRGNATENGFEITGELGGLDMGMELYQYLVLNGAANAVPGTVVRTTPMTLVLTDGQDTDPQSMTIAINKAEVRFGSFTAAGADKVRCDCTWRMIDDSATDPVTWTIVNGIDDYGEDHVES